MQTALLRRIPKSDRTTLLLSVLAVFAFIGGLAFFNPTFWDHVSPFRHHHAQRMKQGLPTPTGRVSVATTEEVKDARMLCWVLTQPSTHDTKAQAVLDTWGPLCDQLVFFTTQAHEDSRFIVLSLSRPESRKLIYEKSKAAWEYVMAHYLNDFDWFLKVDDDTYVHIKNTKEFLRQYNASEPHYLGRQFTLLKNTARAFNYTSGSAGYILSKGALRRLQSSGDGLMPVFPNIEQPEDIELARALVKVGVTPEDTRDPHARERFLPFPPDKLRYEYSTVRNPTFWFWSYTTNPAIEGEDCCSRKWVSAHLLSSESMYKMHEKVLTGKEGSYP